MSAWLRTLATWRTRRRRFAEEWAFHLDAAAAEWESLGFSRREARKQAKRRLGSKRSYRREALRSIGGDVAGLLELLPLRAFGRSAILVPLTLFLVSVFSIVCDPYRSMALECLKAIMLPGSHVQLERVIPATPSGSVPVDVAALALRVWLILSAARIALNLASRALWRLCLYACAVMAAMAFAGAVFWIVGMQFLVIRSWGHDGIQGLSVIAFVFAFVGLLYGANRLCLADVVRRCPICLRVPGMPVRRGNENDILVEPLEVESICFHGHGTLTKNRWLQQFARGAPLFPM